MKASPRRSPPPPPRGVCDLGRAREHRPVRQREINAREEEEQTQGPWSLRSHIQAESIGSVDGVDRSLGLGG